MALIESSGPKRFSFNGWLPDSARMQEIVIDAGALGLAGVNRSFLSLADDDHDYGRAPSRMLIVHRLDGLDAFRLAATPFTSGVEFRLTWDRHGLVGWTAFQITTNIHERHQPPQISFKETCLSSSQMLAAFLTPKKASMLHQTDNTIDTVSTL